MTDTTFNKCRFDDTDIQNCDFDHVIFVECEFQHLLIKTCRFKACEFIHCSANNKLFETCRFVDCSFRSTELQVQTIAENFGITSSGYHGKLRRNRIDVSKETLTKADLKIWLRKAKVHPLYKVNVEYFLQETLVEGSAQLDMSVKLDSWLPMFRNANSFVVVLNQWVDFLLWLHDENKAATQVIVAAHSMTGQLLSELQNRTEHHADAGGLSGAYLSLARTVDPYLELVEICAVRYLGEVTLLVEGSGTKSHYERRFKPILAHGDAMIVSVLPHNSPWDLVVSFGSMHGATLFFAFVLATRTHIELSRIRERVLQGSSSKKSIKPTSALTRQVSVADSILSVEFGMVRPSATAPTLRLRAYLPGNLLAELRITVGSRQIAKLRKTIKDIL